DEIVAKLKGSSDPKRRYEYVLWLAKKLPPAPAELQCESNRVKGCVSQVFVQPQLDEGLLQWQGDADAQITKGLLALLITGLNGLSAAEVVAIDPSFMAETGLQASLTPSRANGFLNILLHMQAQAAALAATA
ncbi:MAG: SufE family protein, partial [Synechococcaceae bacterium WB7_1C_051]|nr:SufE family protein [Synechococcaceae bacterium WB7_1C_051]